MKILPQKVIKIQDDVMKGWCADNKAGQMEVLRVTLLTHLLESKHIEEGLCLPKICIACMYQAVYRCRFAE